jgi:hypothetical protein
VGKVFETMSEKIIQKVRQKQTIGRMGQRSMMYEETVRWARVHTIHVEV